jgi:hypothetical protein
MAAEDAVDVEDGKNGGLMTLDRLVEAGNFGGGEKASGVTSVSIRSICDSDSTESHGGGTILALFCLFSRSANHNGMCSLRGG